MYVFEGMEKILFYEVVCASLVRLIFESIGDR